MATLGLGQAAFIIPAQTSVSTTPIVSQPVWLRHARAASLVLRAGPGSGGTLDGAWLIEGSNDYNGAGQTEAGQAPNTGTWVDITALFKQPSGSAIAAVAHGTAASQIQFAQAPVLACRVMRVTFTPSAGADTVQAAISGGEY